MNKADKEIIRKKIKNIVNCNEFISLNELSNNLADLFESELDKLIIRRHLEIHHEKDKK